MAYDSSVWTGTLLVTGRYLYDPASDRWGLGSGHGGTAFAGGHVFACPANDTTADPADCACNDFVPPTHLLPICR